MNNVRTVQGRHVRIENSLRLAPDSAPAEVLADFSCDVQYPADALSAGCVDECLAEAYRHMRGEERKDVAGKGVEGVREAFFADYREWFDEDWQAVTNGDLTVRAGQWACRVEGCIVHADSRHFSYCVTIDTTTGGLHPNRWIQYASYVREDGRRVRSLDMIRNESMTAVLNLIRKALRTEAIRDSALHAQLKGEIRQSYDEYVRDIRNRTREEWGNPLITDNFAIVKDGVRWVYNQYEIACYASGLFTPLVTWRDLAPHLRDRRSW